ncbi:MAG: DNRLRE domain-containing protein, partial [Burkholderiales bacterium]|nr:DNRLRE domain-containing protein [Phycisphaerae bacterium]
LRGEYVLNGGNPTAGTDPGEVAQYAVGTQPTSSWGGYVYDFGKNFSPNGMIEYKGNAFGGILDGKILITRYSGGDDIMVLTTTANGGISQVQTGFAGLSGFTNPLDMAQDPETGHLYVIEFGDQAQVPGADARITLLKAQAAPAPGTAVATLSRNKVYLSDQTNTSGSSLAQNVRISNTGTGPLTITALTLGGANAGEFTIRDPFGNVINTPVTIQPGSWQDVYITFKATTTGIRTGTLTITTNVDTQTVALRALGLAGSGGNLEPSLQRILDLYQIGVNVGDPDPSTTDFPADTASSPDEVTMPRLVKAGSGPVTVEVLGVFANQTAASLFGWYEAGTGQTKNPVLSVPTAGGQSIAPLQEGAFTFDPGSGNFGIYANFTLGVNSPINRDVYSENSLNTWETVPSRQKKVRFYQLKDANGTVVPNAYVVSFEEYNLSFDQNDMVAIIRNVQPAAAGPELGLENRDAAGFPDRLAMSRVTNKDPNLANEFHDQSTLRIRNTGSQPLNITSTTLSNSDFQIIAGGGARTIQPDGYVDLVVKFVYTSNSLGNALRTATLTINNDDPNEAAQQVQLAGLWQSYSENQPNGVSAEPVVQRIIDTFGYKITVGTLNTQGQPTRAGEEVLSELWQRADNGLPVGVVQLAAYHQMYNVAYATKSTISWYNPTNINGATQKPFVTKVFTHAQVDSQSILPRLDGSTTAPAMGSFMPTNVPSFGFKVDGDWSTDVYNTPNAANNPGHAIRMYAAKDKAGKIIPNAYILMQDYVGVSYANYDYQDNIYLVTNVKPANGPSTPGNPAATAQAGGIALNWADNADGNVTGYNVYRGTAVDGPFIKVNDAPVGVSDYLDAAAPVGTTSYYVIRAVNYHGQESAQSQVASATRTAGGPAVPNAPSNAVATANGSASIVLTWNDNSTDETNFRIERRTGSGAYATLTTVSAGVTTYTDTSIAGGTTYTYRVFAYNVNGSSGASNEAAATTTAANPLEIKSTDIGNPTPAGNVNVITPQRDYDVTVGGLDIWGTYDSFNFQHQQRTGDFDVSVQVADLTAVDPSTQGGLMMREALTTGSRHVMVKVRPGGFRLNYRTSTNGTTSASGTASATFPNAFVRLQRVGNTFNTFVSTDGANWTPFGSVTINVGATVYVGMATAAKSNSTATTAKYRNFGDTGTAAPVQPPAAATGLNGAATSHNSVALNWSDASNNETGFRIERRTGSGGTWSTIGSVGANVQNYVDDTAQASTEYWYRIRSYNSGGDADPTPAFQVITPPAPSGNTTLTSIADAYVQDGSSAGVNFGSASGIQVKSNSSAGYNRRGYLKFDISSLSSVSQVKLRVFANLNTADNVGVAVYGVDSTTWTEGSINFNNKPTTTGGALGSATVSSTAGAWIEVDITSFVQQAIANGKASISLSLQGTASSTAFVNVASRESGANAPQLVIS